MAGEALGDACRGLETGMTELEITRRSADALAARGARAVVNLVAADDRIGAVPSSRGHGAALGADGDGGGCAQRDGLVVSLTRIVSAGPASDDLRRRTRATAGSWAAARGHPFGATGRQLYGEAARAYAEAGFPGEERRHHRVAPAAIARTGSPIPRATTRRPPQAFAWNPSITGTKSRRRPSPTVTTTPSR